MWEAITDGGIRSRYTFGAHLTTTTRAGEPIVQSVSPSGPVLCEGTTIEMDPPRRLVQTMHAVWSDEVRAEGVTRVTWEIEQVGDPAD